MSYARTFARAISKARKERAIQIAQHCPVCGSSMKHVWWSRKTRRCPICKTTVRVPWLMWR